MIRRQKSMQFLGGYYAFPGGKVDPGDAIPGMFARCRGVDAADAERVIPSVDGLPALAFWVSVARELCEETGVLVAQEEHGRPVDARHPAVLERIEALRRALVSFQEPF